MYGVEVESGKQVRRDFPYYNGKLRYSLACRDRRKFKLILGSSSKAGDGGENRHLKSEFTLFRNSSPLFHVGEFSGLEFWF